MAAWYTGGRGIVLMKIAFLNGFGLLCFSAIDYYIRTRGINHQLFLLPYFGALDAALSFAFGFALGYCARRAVLYVHTGQHQKGETLAVACGILVLSIQFFIAIWSNPIPRDHLSWKTLANPISIEGILLAAYGLIQMIGDRL
jgi:hypothetical protein